MLLESEDRTVTSSGLQQVARATIKTSPKIFNFFADQTYANKPKAICRELAANAVDSHVMAGKPDEPIEIWLPTLLDPTFRVRDHGLGMSHDFMMTSFMCYADGSTKDGSNQAIGGFGIGSKSPFAYVDQYTVKSIFEGIESVYSIFKDEDGIPAIGLLGQRATKEPNGVSVEFPVQPDDFKTFEEAAFEALRYFEPLPDVKNAIGGAFCPPAYVSRGDNWGMRETSGDLLIIMGGVPYPVNVNNLTYKFPDDSPARKLLRYGLDLRVPIGTCSVALSREALSYDDRTIDAIRVVCEGVIEEVKASFATMFDAYETEWQAATALHNEVGDNAHGERASFLSENALWRGKPLEVKINFPMLQTRSRGDGSTYEAFGYDTWTIGSRHSRATRRGKIKSVGPANFTAPDKFGLVPGAFQYVIVDDLPQEPKSKAARKIKEFVEENATQSVLCLRNYGWQDEKLRLTPEQLIAGFGMPADMVVLTSSLPEPVTLRRTGSRMNNRPKVRMFSYNGKHQHHNWRQPPLRIAPDREGVVEIPYLEQPESGILVVMDNFIPTVDVRDFVSSTLIAWDEIRFVNQADAKKLKKGSWVSLKDEFERRKKEKLAAYPELAQRLAVADCHELRRFFELFLRNPSIDFTSRKPLGRIFKLYQDFVLPLTVEQRELARFVEAKLPKGVKPTELVEKFNKQQWRTRLLMTALPGHRAFEEDELKLFLENM